MNEKQAKSAVNHHKNSLKYYNHRWNESMVNRDSALMKSYSKEIKRIKKTIFEIKDKTPEYFL